jgi:hypothetical protein
MASAQDKKRQNVMLGIAMVLLFLVIFSVIKKKSPPSSTGQTSGFMSSLTGGNIATTVREYENAVQQRGLTLQEKIDIDRLEEDILKKRPEFWAYTKAGTPRGEVHQHIRNVAKNAGIEEMRVNVGYEKSVSGSEYLKMIDFSLSHRDFDMKKMADFMGQIDEESAKYYWTECKIYYSGNSLVFFGNLRVYVLNNKAVALFGKKS